MQEYTQEGCDSLSPTIEHIFQAAQELFVTKGYFNTTIPDIVKKSGVSIGSIYHHFESKQHLASELHQHSTNICSAGLLKRINAESNLKKKLRAVVFHLFDQADTAPIRLQYIFYTNHEEIQEPVDPACPSQLFIAVRELIDECTKEDLLKDLPSDILTSAFMGIPLQIIDLKFHQIIQGEMTSRVDEAFQLCWDAVKS